MTARPDPPMGYGAMGITAFYGSALSDDQVPPLLRAAYEAGATHFDTAEIYRSGNPFEPPTDATIFNEVQVGRALKELNWPRDSFQVATKHYPARPVTTEESVSAAFHASLKRLELDHIDVYYLHRMPADGLEGLKTFMRTVKGLIAAGKVRYIGLSEAPIAWIKEVNEIHPVSYLQYEWSILERGIEEAIIPTAKEIGATLVAYSPLARNVAAAPAEKVKESDWRSTLPRFQGEDYAANLALAERIKAVGDKAGVSAAAVSLRWLLQRAAELGIHVIPIPGSTKVERVEGNSSAWKLPAFSAEDFAELSSLASAVKGARGDEAYTKRGYEGQTAKAGDGAAGAAKDAGSL